MKIWSVEEMLAERPCDAYTRERLTELWAGRERLTLDEVLELNISDSDRVWAICRGLEREQLLAWVERIVARAVTNHALHCGVEAVEEWAARWLSGEDRTAKAAEAAVWRSKTPEAEAAAWAAASHRRAAWSAEWAQEAAAYREGGAVAVERERSAEIKRQIADYRAVST